MVGLMEYQVNRGKICCSSGCSNKARVKGLCMSCYVQKKEVHKGKN